MFAYWGSGNGAWTAMPFTTYNNTGGSFSWGFTYATNAITITVSNSANVDESSFFNGYIYYFKFLTITPQQRRSHPNTNWNNYNEAIAVTSSESAATN